MKWWLQCFLVDIKHFLIGLRDDNGIVRKLVKHEVSKIYERAEVGRWDRVYRSNPVLGSKILKSLAMGRIGLFQFHGNRFGIHQDRLPWGKLYIFDRETHKHAGDQLSQTLRTKSILSPWLVYDSHIEARWKIKRTLDKFSIPSLTTNNEQENYFQEFIFWKHRFALNSKQLLHIFLWVIKTKE